MQQLSEHHQNLNIIHLTTASTYYMLSILPPPPSIPPAPTTPTTYAASAAGPYMKGTLDVSRVFSF